MDFEICRRWYLFAIVMIGCCCANSGQTFASMGDYGCQPAQPVANGMTFDQQLVRCLEIAKQGDVKQAFALAKQTKQLYRNQRMFDVSYVNVLMSIVDETESSCDVKILNEVITVVRDAKKSHAYDGNGDAEVAFHFMKAMGRLALITDNFNEAVAHKIRIYEGNIAKNLKSNPAYPKYAMEALSLPMVDMAKAYAFYEKKEPCFAALTDAVRSGFGEYKSACEESWIENVADKNSVANLINQLDKEYEIAVQNWSRTVVAQFQPIDFRFDVTTLKGQQLNNQLLQGKVVVVDLWATWCPPCRKGLPHFSELHKKYSKDVAVVGISMDRPTDPNSAFSTVKAFAKKEKLKYFIAMGDQSIEGQLRQKMVLPTTIFFDRSGKVRYIARGYHDSAKLEAITKLLVQEQQPVNFRLCHSKLLKPVAYLGILHLLHGIAC